ncbi:MAG: hypothetical protein ACRC0X_05365 [Brevinema sp.]
MHYLDNRITEIEKNINGIITLISEGNKGQTYLEHILIINIESWITWKTLRFLLRTVDIDKKTDKKWIQTPSSVSLSQLKAIWHFDNYRELDSYIKEITKEKLNVERSLENIHKKLVSSRNKVAHFTMNIQEDLEQTDETQRGTLSQEKESELCFTVFKNIFDTVERIAFLRDIHDLLIRQEYIPANQCPYIIYWDKSSISNKILLNEFENKFSFNSTICGVCLAYELAKDIDNNAPHLCIEFNRNRESGWGVRCINSHPLYQKYEYKNKSEYYPYWEDIELSDRNGYNIWGEKQYYRDIRTLIDQIDRCSFKSKIHNKEQNIINK